MTAEIAPVHLYGRIRSRSTLSVFALLVAALGAPACSSDEDPISPAGGTSGAGKSGTVGVAGADQGGFGAGGSPSQAGSAGTLDRGTAGKAGASGSNTAGSGGETAGSTNAAAGSTSEGGVDQGGTTATAGSDNAVAGATIGGSTDGVAGENQGGTAGLGSAAAGVAGQAGASGDPCTIQCPLRDDCDDHVTCDLSLGTCTYFYKSGCAPLPPDPLVVGSQIAPLDPTVPLNLRDGTRFLYTQKDASLNTQQGVTDPGVIDDRRVVVLNGRVMDRNGKPLSRVKVTVKDHPEFGFTLSRYNGEFDLVANGGGQLTVQYERDQYLQAQRQVEVPWNDYKRVDDVILIQMDDSPTTIDSSSAQIQVHRSKQETDSDGTRRMTLLFLPGTTAAITLPDCSAQTLTKFSVQAVEYTVGPRGPDAMPAGLPATVAYTYAVELSLVEAVATKATKVSFSQPVVAYVENFLHIPVGSPVPLGSYDRERGQWVPSETGRVIRIDSVSIAGLAELVIDGSGVAASAEVLLSELGIRDIERKKLAEQFPVGVELSRIRFSHFSPHDANYAYDTVNRQGPTGTGQSRNGEDNSCESSGSIIECQNQVLGQLIPISGTPLELRYQSSRVPGLGRGVDLEVSVPAEVTDTYTNRQVTISVAGRSFPIDLPREQLSGYRLGWSDWDGKDRYGRDVQGPVVATVTASALSSGYYCRAAYFADKRYVCTVELTRIQVPLRQTLETVTLQQWDARGFGFGGWTMNLSHVYDPKTQTLQLGLGKRRSVENVGRVLSSVAGSDFAANEPSLRRDIAVGPDGSVYFGDGCTVRAITNAGVVTVAGNGSCGSAVVYAPAGIPPTGSACQCDAPTNEEPLATSVPISPVGLAVGPDAALYIVSGPKSSFLGGEGGVQVLRVDPSTHTIRRIAGNGNIGDSEGKPATDASFDASDVAVSPDGAVYLADPSYFKIRRIGTDGAIRTLAGNGSTGDCTGSLSAGFLPSTPTRLDVGADGSLYVVDTGCQKVVRILPDGDTTVVADASKLGGSNPISVSLNRSGNVLVAATDGTIWTIDSMGAATRVVGSGSNSFVQNAPATGTSPGNNIDIASSPDNTLLVRAPTLNKVLRMSPPPTGIADNEYVVPDDGGNQLFVFDPKGRHLRTLDALTRAVIFEFSYDTKNLIVQVNDSSGNATKITRSSDGKPTSIEGPFGQVTKLTLDANGYLASVTNAANETTSMTYGPGGLMATFKDPRSQEHKFEYDKAGRLTKDTDPGEHAQTLKRTDGESTGNYSVALTSPLGRVNNYKVSRSGAPGQARFEQTTPANVTTVTEQGSDGSSVTTLPDGTKRTIRQAPDDRFGMRVPVNQSETVVLPSGLTSTSATARKVVVPGNILSLPTINEQTIVNGARYESTYDGASRTRTKTSPEGRKVVETLDSLGRVIGSSVSGMAATSFSYDNQGRPTEIVQGTGTDARTTKFAYEAPPKGQLLSVTDPMGRTTKFLQRDAIGRVLKLELPGGREVDYSYDGNSNVTSVTPPGKPAHGFVYSAVDLVSQYSPPNLGTGTWATGYLYSSDRELTQVTRPDAQSLTYTYEPNTGRFKSVTYPAPTTPSINESVVPTYDSAGRVETITSGSGVVLTYGYDGSLVTSETWSGAVTGSVESQYDANFRVVSETVNGANGASFLYDDDGLLTHAGVLEFVRKPDNGLIESATSGGVAEAFSYSAFGELSSHSAIAPDTSALLNIAYQRDKLGRITQKTEAIGGATTTYVYGYDEAGRLASVSKNGAVSVSYFYDLNGNRTRVEPATGSPLTAAYDAQDRLLSYNGANYTYTANGELLTKVTSAGTTSYSYDVLGNLRKVALPDGTVIEYLVDSKNRRVGKKVNGTLVQAFIYENALSPVAELDGAGNVVSRFVYGTRVNVPEYMVRGGATYRIITDHLGSPRLVVDAARGAIAQQMDYDEWGVVLNDSSPGFQPFGFAGGLYDRDTRLVRFGARDYFAVIGRWASADSIGFAGGDSNLYEYGLGDPVNQRDPRGLTSSSCCSQSFLDCLAKCIQAADAMDDVEKGLLTLWGASIPKAVFGLPRTGGGYMSLPSYLSLGNGTAASGTNVPRILGRFANAAWIGYGLFMFGAEAACSAACAYDSCII